MSDAERSLWDDGAYADRQERLNTLLASLETSTDALTTASCKLEIAGLQLDLDNKTAASEYLQGLVALFIEHQQFEQTAMACQYIYLCDTDNAVCAIGQAAWLAITYPVDPNLTISILDNIVDETPDESDGAAVAAATAHYVVDLRAPEDQKAHLHHVTGSMLARVAKRHSHIEDQQQFDVWARTLELDEPDKFLVRMRNVIDVMVQQDWWFDRETLQDALPAGDD
ncbi:MAG: hypothetical protein AAF404_09590 [Pseudomonadota bacterium]